MDARDSLLKNAKEDDRRANEEENTHNNNYYITRTKKNKERSIERSCAGDARESKKEERGRKK